MKREPDMPARHDATRSALSESVLEDLLPPRLRDGNGIEAATAIRDRFGIPFVLATAYADEEIQRRIAAVDPLASLVKPVALGAIQRILETAEALVEAKRRDR